MERINKHNYEVFFLDYIEGNLDDSYKNELERFLNENPSLREELEGFEDIKLHAEDVTFEQKELLIKETQSKLFEISELEYLCVGDLENDLDDDELKELKRKLEGSLSKQEVYDLMKQTKLKPDLNISYPHKKRLQRRILPQVARIGATVAAAAAITLVLILIKPDDNSSYRAISYASLNNSKNLKIKPVDTNQTNNNKSNVKQEAFNNSHNQTIIHTQTNDLAFNDNVPHDNDSLYKERIVSIPDIRSEALIKESDEQIIASFDPGIKNEEQALFKKENLWKYAETGLSVWKLLSSDDIEMKNKYTKDGKIEKMNLVASNFKFSKTFNKR